MKPATVDHREKTFEAAIEDSLLQAGGYIQGRPEDYNAEQAIFPATLIAFLKDTQPESWEKLAGIYGANVEQKIIDNIVRTLDQQGMLSVLRRGVMDRGIKLNLAYFKPSSGLNPDTLALYDKNILTITRQVHHSPKNPAHSVDVVLSLNGLPVATAELKQPFTGQTVKDAIRQYQNDRDPFDPLFRFKQRALVHFAVDPDEVYMTTKLAGKSTFFLPFNKGRGTGAGNPDNPNGYKTAYLWENVWSKDRWLEILARFVHLEVTEKIKDGSKIRKETMVFPRYHQLDAVTKLLKSVKSVSAGKNYLIQHSAGSGKSNSIAWLAHRLANLHDAKDQLVFHSVIVITDRTVLDQQLQDNIYQMDHVQGVVECIARDRKGESESKSAQLGNALRTGKRIIITTIQTFPHVIEEIGNLSERRFAIIADEAHSSQTGDTAKKLKQILQSGSLEQAEAEEAKEESKEEDTDDVIRQVMASHGTKQNLSFFAFTATPKKKTLEMFGEPGPDGKPVPFHLYSMRQAIEEGFILDVLKHYMTYKTYFRLQKSVEDDPAVEKKKAKRAIARFVSLHPHNLAQKTEIMVEHFRRHTRHKIGGQAKAMVVTRSRLHAVRYKQEFDSYIKKKGYFDLKTLVAFSGTVIDEDTEFTEPGMNGFGEKELPEKFNSDDYQVLIVAEKYQTGFDQPLLHTMFVDKKLKGLKAVQTLSRLNRTCAGKEDTFVLDFENSAEDIQEAFKPYYELTEIDEPTEPNQIYTVKSKLDQFQYYHWQEVEQFASVFFKPQAKQNIQDQGKLHALIDPAVQRFRNEPDDSRREEFRSQLNSYVRLYNFLSQMIAFGDPDLEKLYAYGRFLKTKLPQREDSGMLDLGEEVTLAYYRNDKTFEGSIGLDGENVPLKGMSDIGTGQTPFEAESPLSEIIKTFNERFSTEFKPEDRLLFDQVVQDLQHDERLMEQARQNPIDRFKYAFDEKAMDAFIARMERNEGISSVVMNNPAMREIAFTLMMKEFYKKAQFTD